MDISGYRSQVGRSLTSERHVKVLSFKVSSKHIIRKICLNSNAYYMLLALTHEQFLTLYSNLFVHILYSPTNLKMSQQSNVENEYGSEIISNVHGDMIFRIETRENPSPKKSKVSVSSSSRSNQHVLFNVIPL